MGREELRAEGVGGSGRQVPRACGSSSSLPRALDLGSALVKSLSLQLRGSQTEIPRETPMRPLDGGTICPWRPGAALISKEAGALLDPDL